jgi:hypothetical protein
MNERTLEVRLLIVDDSELSLELSSLTTIPFDLFSLGLGKSDLRSTRIGRKWRLISPYTSFAAGFQYF